MKKRKFSALLAAACATLVAPNTAGAEDLNFTTSQTHTTTGAETYDNMNVSGTGTTATLTTPANNTLNITGNVNMSDNSAIQFTDAVANVTFNQLNVNGGSGNTNRITKNSTSTGTTSITDAVLANNSSLSIENSGSAVNVTNKVEMNTSSLNTSGTGTVGITTVELNGTGTNSINGSSNLTIDNLTFQSGNTLNTEGAVQYGTVSQSGVDTMSNTGNVQINNISTNSNTSKFTVESKSGTTQISSITGTSKNIELNANNGNIQTTGNIQLNADNTLTLSGTNNISLNGIRVSSNTANLNNTNANTNLGSVNIDSTIDFEIKETSKTTFTAATLTPGTGTTSSVTDATTLTLDATDAAIEGNSVNMNGNSSLVVKGAQTGTNVVTLTGTSAGVNVSGRNNSINMSDAGLSNIKKITIGDDTTDGQSEVSVNGLSTNNFSGFEVTDKVNVITSQNSNLRNINVNAYSATEKRTLQINANGGTNNFTTISANNSDITLKGGQDSAGTSTLSGTSVTLSGGASLDATKLSLDNGTNNEISLSGSGNNITADTNSSLGTIGFTAAGSTVRVNSLNSSGTNKNFDGFANITNNNETIETNDSHLGNLNVSANNTLTIKNVGGNSTFSAGTETADTGLASGSTLNITSEGGSGSTINATSIRMNGQNNVNVTTTSGTPSIGTVYYSGNDSGDSANTITNNSSTTLSITNLNPANTAEDNIVLNGSGGKISVTNFNQNGTDTLNTQGTVDITNINADGNQLTLNTTSGTTTLTNINRGGTEESPSALKINFNASEGATINKTTATNVTTNDILRIQGDGNVNLSGGVNISGTGKIYVENQNSNLGDLTLASGSTLDTRYDYATASDMPIVNDTIVTDLISQGDGSTETPYPTWELDLDRKTMTADSITITDGTDTTGSLDFNVTALNNPTTQASNFVTYIDLVNFTNPDNEKSVLDTTFDNGNYFKHRGNIYYSYVNPDDGIDNQDYAYNRVRITNYDLGSDNLLDAITKEGEREYILVGSETNTHYAAATGNIDLPNMQARQGANNVLDIRGLGYITGSNAGDTSRAQLFVIDSTDGISRTANINGLQIIRGYTNPERTNGVTANSGDGAALRVVSNDAENAPATVNLSSYTGTGQSGETLTVHPTFHDNIATGNGGAMHSSGAGAKINLVKHTTASGEEEAVHLLVYNNAAGNDGGGIYNTDSSTIDFSDNANGVLSFYNNTAGNDGGAIYNTNNAILKIGPGENGNLFLQNRAGEEVSVPNYASGDYTTETTFTTTGGNGGAINNNNGASLTITGDTEFERNIAGSLTSEEAGNSSNGGAIYNNNATLAIGDTDSTTTFTYNEAFGDGGAVASVNNDATFTGNVIFDGNIATGNGGAYSATEGSTVNFEGSQTFTGNASEGKGGAIYGKDSIINITANNGNTVFQNNIQDAVYSTSITADGHTIDTDCGHEIDENGKHVVVSSTLNAIYLDGDTTLNLNTTDNNEIHFNDKIASSGTTDSIVQNGTVYYHHPMDDHDGTPGYTGSFYLQSGRAYFTDPESRPFQNADYKIDGGTLLAMKNNVIIPVHARTLDLSGTTKDNPAYFTMDLNMKQGTSDRFVLDTPSDGGNILVTDMNITGKNTTKKQIFFNIAEGANVDSVQKKVDTDIYQYNIKGQKSGLLFERGNIHTPLVGPQVAVNARLAGQLDFMNNLLHRVDEIAETRYFHAASRENLYAADPDVLDDRRIDNGYTPYVNQVDGGNTWVKPSFTIEKINPKGFHKYNNKAYNTFLGYEAPVATLRNGWDLINTVFAGYQGSYQSYNGFHNYQNGGSAGYMANLYHNNFFAGGVVMLGGSAVETTDKTGLNRGMNYGLFDVGASARVGYNVGMGKHWVFQPMFTGTYMYISGVDRHNHRGQRIKLDGTNTLQIAPGFKIVGNYGGWQPYVLFDYTWPFIAKTVAHVNNIGIPDVKLRSYVEYGAGLRKNIGERFTGYGEAVVRNGGRTGVSIQGGLLFRF